MYYHAAQFGRTPLCRAAWEGHVDVVEALLEDERVAPEHIRYRAPLMTPPLPTTCSARCRHPQSADFVVLPRGCDSG